MLADEVRAGEEPTFVDLRVELGARVVAERTLRAGKMSDAERDALIAREHRETLAGAVGGDLGAFVSQVEAEIDNLSRGRGNPEQPLPDSPPRARRLPLLDPKARDLTPLLERVASSGRDLLPRDIAERLGDPPPVEWTKRPMKHAWAYHLLRREGARRGEAVIRVNRLLCADRATVPDDLLEYLLWHELLHHLLPTQGHDHQFNALEDEWPGSQDLARQLDTFHETWETDPAAYRAA